MFASNGLFPGLRRGLFSSTGLFAQLRPNDISGVSLPDLRTSKTSRGLEALRSLIPALSERGDGVILVGEVGITSHFGDILRKARTPVKDRLGLLSLPNLAMAKRTNFRSECTHLRR